MDEELIKRDHPEEVTRQLVAEYGRRLRLSELFHGEKYEPVRAAIKATGRYTSDINGRTLHVQTRPIEGTEDHEVIAIAAVARDPGRTQDYIDLIADFQAQTGGNQKANQIKQYWEIYKTEGIVNNAINKYASLLSVGGHFKVRNAKKGKTQDATVRAQTILDFWVRNVNGPTPTGVATAARGLRAVTEQGIRMALVEGDYMGRTVWGTHDVGTLGKFALPMTIQTLSMEFMTPLTDLQGLGELWYWTPPDALKKLITGDTKPSEKLVKDILKRLFDNDIAKQIKANGKALLDPALLVHVKHRGSERDPYGESFIEPAKLGIRYLRSVTNTDMVSMENVINRLMIVMVGTSDPSSPYSKADVAAARAALMQTFFEDPGPNMTIVWQGDDVKVETVSAQNELLDLTERHQIGERKIVVALGIPSALLDGTSSDGKAAGWAALISANGQVEHLGGAFATAWTIIGERILLENKFTDLDITFEFDRSNMADKEQERNQNRNDYIVGLVPIRTMIAAMGRDPDAEFQQMCFEKGLDPSTTLWADAFAPPQGLPGQGTSADPNAPAAPQGQGGGKVPGNGRTPDNVKGKPKSKTPVEKKSPDTQK